MLHGQAFLRRKAFGKLAISLDQLIHPVIVAPRLHQKSGGRRVKSFIIVSFSLLMVIIIVFQTFDQAWFSSNSLQALKMIKNQGTISIGFQHSFINAFLGCFIVKVKRFPNEIYLVYHYVVACVLAHVFEIVWFLLLQLLLRVGVGVVQAFAVLFSLLLYLFIFLNQFSFKFIDIDHSFSLRHLQWIHVFEHVCLWCRTIVAVNDLAARIRIQELLHLHLMVVLLLQGGLGHFAVGF